MANILAIYDQDKKYVRKLASYIDKKGDLPFEIQGFDSKVRLYNYMQSHKLSVLLVDDKCFEEDFKDFADQIILLKEKRSEEWLEWSERFYPTICKYQSGEAICKKLLDICLNVPSEIWSNPIGKNEKNRNCEIIGVYSPIKRCFQTSFSLIYSRLKSNEKKTLYLNFEVFSGFSTWFQKEYQADLMDLLYFLKDDPDRFLLKMKGMTEEFGNVKYIPPACSYSDFLAITEEQWIKLIQMIATKSDFEVLVLDLSDQMRGLFSLLSMCDKVYTITKPDGLAMAKITDYEKMLRMDGKEDVLNKTVKCRLPVFKDISQDVSYLTHSQLADYMKNKLGEDFGASE